MTLNGETKNPALESENIRSLSAGNFVSVLDGGYADCLGTLGALGDLELNPLVLVERPVAFALDLGMMN
ncbi:MAG: hypothetical protein QOI25_3836, partial [Mycobacterium sp.]|nr:hypothetical protein [Mycobacterium sp.]